MPGIKRCVGVMDCPQAVNVAFTKQVAAFHHLFDQLFEADALPFSLTAFADTFHGLENA